jgi:type I restriction enzyme S subunit
MEPARRQERVVPDAKEVRFADVLINSTGVGTLGRAAVFLEDRPGITVDSHVTIVRAASLEARPWLGLHMLERQPELQTMGVGSTGQTELGRQAIADLKLAVPADETLSAFAQVAWPLLVSVPTVLQRNEALAATRDLLVPRLVTGRLDISDVDLGDFLPTDPA